MLKMKSFNSKLFMKKRKLTLFYAVNASIITLIISNGILVFFFANYSHPMNSFMISLAVAVWSPSAYAWLCLLVMNNWLIWYRYRWTYYISQSKWQQIINPNVLSDDMCTSLNWFILNNAKYGQFKAVSKYFGGAAVCCCLILIPLNFWAFAYHFGNIAVMLPTFAAFFLTFQPWSAVYIYCVWKTPSLDDAFAIHWESKMHAKILCSTFPLYLPGFIYMVITGDVNGWIVSVSVYSIQLFFILFVSTHLVTQRVKRNNTLSTQEHDDSISLKMVLENEITLNLFMNHLSSELSAWRSVFID